MGIIPNHFFTFNGFNSKDFGVWISGSGTYGAPSWDVEEVSIPGRNGTLHIDKGRLNNISITYPAFIPRHWPVKWAGFKNAMLHDSGFHRLEDTYHPDFFRLASYVGPLEPEVTAANLSGAFDISFICCPERWLKDGERLREITSGTVLMNPTGYKAKPLIRVVGSGAISFGGVYWMGVNSETEYIDIDCELMDAFCGSTNCNRNIGVPDGFPVLDSGETRVNYTGFTSVQIAPRWWTV